MSEERAHYITKLSDLAEALNPDVGLCSNEARDTFRNGWDITARSTEDLLGELAFYRWLNGFSYVLKMHRIRDVDLPHFEQRYSYVRAELQARGVDTARDYTSKPQPTKPKATGGIEL